jgi:hypothetical protein
MAQNTQTTFLPPLGINDCQRMLEWEIAHKKRPTVIKALKQLIGDDRVA